MLNDRECKNAKRQKKPYKLPDGNGLYLEVKSNGGKAWRYRFGLRQDGMAKESVFVIGTYASPPSAASPTRLLRRSLHCRRPAPSRTNSTARTPSRERRRQVRDDEHAVECWDSERGEFVTMLSMLARSMVLPAGHFGWLDDGYVADLWHEARPAAIDAALASILALRGAG